MCDNDLWFSYIYIFTLRSNLESQTIGLTLTLFSRWFGLLAAVMKTKSREAKDLLINPSVKIVTTALEVNGNREGKPYSAAATVESALRLVPLLMEISPSVLQALKLFFEKDLARLIVSPSSKYLISVLFLFRPGHEKEFEKVWESAVASSLEGSHSAVVVNLISNDVVANMAKANPSLQTFLASAATSAIHDVENAEAWSLFDSAVTFGSLLEKTESKLFDQLLEKVDANDAQVNGALKGLEVLAKKNPVILRRERKTYVALITKLLALSELSDSTIHSRAARLRGILEESDESSVQQDAKSPMLHIIHENLENANSQTLAVDTLVQQAKAILSATEGSPAIFPDITIWHQTLAIHLSSIPNPALGVMRPFAGAVFLTHPTSGKASSIIARDLNGYSIPLRMAMYTARLLGTDDSLIPDVEILYLLSITTQLVQDQVDLQGEDQLFSSLLDPDIANEVQEFLFIANTPLNNMISSASGWLDDYGAVMASGASYSSGILRFLISRLIQETSTNTPVSFHAARILSNILQHLINDHGWHNVHGEAWLLRLDILKSSTNNVLGATAILIGLQDILGTSKIVNNLCNRLVSDIAGASAQSEKTLRLLVLLNASFTVYEEGDLPVAQNRLVFAVKQILSWTDTLPSTYSSMAIASEACYSLHRLLPAIKDVYGSYWGSALSYCIVSILQSSIKFLTRAIFWDQTSAINLILLPRQVGHKNANF